jgi:outer membrane protein
MMRPLCALIFSAIVLNTALAQDSLTVDQVLRRVLETHPAIAQAEQNIHAAEARVLESASALSPDVTTEASYAFLGPVAKLSFPGIGDFRLYPANNYDAHIGGRYTLYDFGKVDAAVDLNRSRVQTSRDAVELTRSTLAYQVIRVFYAILLLEKSIGVQNEQIDALRQHIDITKRRVSAGTATSFDVLTTQVRVAAAQNQKIDLENAAAKQRAILSQLLGLKSGSSVHVRGDLEQTSIPLNNDSLLQAAIRQRTELRLAQDAGISAELQQKVALLGNKPTLRMNLTYGLKNGYIPNLDVLRGNWVAGVRAEVPIFDGGRTDHQQEEAQAVILAEEARQRDIQQQIRSDVEQAVTDVQSAAAKIPISEIQVQQAKDAVSIARSRYEIGTLTNLDLLDAQTAESTARLGNLQALYKLILSKYELQRAIGAKPLE